MDPSIETFFRINMRIGGTSGNKMRSCRKSRQLKPPSSRTLLSPFSQECKLKLKAALKFSYCTASPPHLTHIPFPPPSPQNFFFIPMTCLCGCGWNVYIHKAKKCVYKPHRSPLISYFLFHLQPSPSFTLTLTLTLKLLQFNVTETFPHLSYTSLLQILLTLHPSHKSLLLLKQSKTNESPTTGLGLPLPLPLPLPIPQHQQHHHHIPPPYPNLKTQGPPGWTNTSLVLGSRAM